VTLRVAVTGASGLIGSALAPCLTDDGHDVLRLVRRKAGGPGEREWDGSSLDPAALEGVDAVVHLAGAGVGDRRWDDAHKRAILDSRVIGTTAVAEAVAQAGVPVSP
jgi:uncharacterized protein